MASNSKEVYTFKLFELKDISGINHSDNPPPQKIRDSRMFCSRYNIYIFGSRAPSYIFSENILPEIRFDELWKFNCYSRKWDQIILNDEYQGKTLLNSLFVDGQRLFIFSGNGASDDEDTNKTLHICDLSDNYSIDEIDTSGDIPKVLFGHAVIFDRQYLYCFGGYNTKSYKHSSDLNRLNMSTGVWEPVHKYTGAENEPNPRYCYGLATYETSLYVIGGERSATSLTNDILFAFNLKAKFWRRLRTLPDPKYSTLEDSFGFPYPRLRGESAHVPGSSSVYVYGGYKDGGVLNDLWKLDLSNYQWTCITMSFISSPQHFYSAAVTRRGCMYVSLRESGRSSQHKTNKVYAAWVCVPKLLEICWDAMLHYVPNIDSYSKDYLREIGIPPRLIGRLDG